MRAFKLVMLPLFGLLPFGSPMASDGYTAAMVDGQLVISGSNFANENPMIFWDDVSNAFHESGLTVGDEVKVGSGSLWDANTNIWGEPFHYGNVNGRNNKDEVVYYGEGRKNYLGKPNVFRESSGSKLYVSWWYKPSMDPGAEGGSNKFIRIWDNESGEGTRISWTHMHLTCGESTEWGKWTNSGKVGQWNRNEIYVDLGKNLVETWVNGSKIHEMNDCQKLSNENLYIGMVGFDHGSNSYSDMTTRIDDVYVGKSSARIEISSSPTWSSGADREVLPVESWTDQKITAGLVNGKVQLSSNTYVYIFDEYGNYNDSGIKVDCKDCPKMVTSE